MAQNKREDPSTTSGAYERMAPRIDLVNALMGGTEAMRAAGETYLPREQAESDANYRSRLGRAVLLNYFQRTVESLVGKPFSKPIQLESDVPPELVKLSENIDRLGNHTNVFARRWFRDGLVKGLSHVMVEFPNTVEQPVVTLEDEKNAANNPYFIHIPPEDVLAAYGTIENGVEKLTHVRIRECEVVREGFEEYTIERVRVLEPGTWVLWRRVQKRWEIENQGKTTLDVIPLVTFYAEREDFMVARPPLTDLANVNIAHWQSASDQRNILTVARFPMLAMSGATDDESKVVIGPRQLLSSINPDSKYYYVEHTGKAIESGRTDLEDLKSDMAILGVELLQKSGSVTATAKAIDSAENISMLQDMTLRFSDALEQAYGLLARWLNIKAGGGSLTVNSNFGLKLNQEADLATIQKARETREISHQHYITELKRRSVLADDFDVEADQKLLDEESTKLLAEQAVKDQLAGGATPVPGTPSPLPLRPAPVVQNA